MKFKRLEIRNINSIAEAVVDFEHLMPESQHIFMIWGPSGSGKSTLLDAICMALFCKTPRLQSIAEKRENQYIDPEFQFSDKTKGIAINDLRQYLRRGTREGWCELQFVGNDSVTYNARTSFAINKNGNLKEIEWLLSSENGRWERKDDIRLHIETVTGLNYDQFCRTTLLAQGEFTKFMKSSQDAKAEILEKLTDTSVYSAIGQRIYQKYSSISKEYEQMMRDNEKVSRLTDDQIAAHQQQIAQVEAEVDNLNNVNQALQEKSQWFKRLTELQKDKTTTETELQKAREESVSEKNTQREQFIQQWEQTESERRTFLERRQLQQNVTAMKREEQQYQTLFQEVTAGNRYLEEQSANTVKELESLDAQLIAQAHKEATFAQAQTLAEKLKQLHRLNEEITKNQRKTGENEKLSAEIQQKAAKNEQDLTQSTASIEGKKAQVEELKKQSEQYDLEKLTTLRVQQNDRITALNNVKSSVLDIKNRQEELRKLKEEFEAGKRDLEELTAKLTQEQEQLAKAEAAQTVAQQCYDASAKSVRDFAKQMRADLHVGEPCPICGQIVEKLLTNEAVEQSVAVLKKQLEEAKKATESAQKTMNATASARAQADGNLNARQTDLQRKSDGKRQKLAELTATCGSLGITVNETILDQIEKQRTETVTALSETEKAIKEATALNKALTKANNELDQLKETATQLSNLQHKTDLKLNSIKTENESLLIQLSEAKAKVEGLVAELSEFLAIPYPAWEKNPLQTANDLTNEANNYANTQERSRQKKELCAQQERELEQVREYERKASALYAWPAATKGKACEKLLDKWMTLTDKCAVLSQKQRDTAEGISQRDGQLQAFHAQHPDIALEVLAQLADTPADAIAKEREALATLRQKVQNTEGRLQQAIEKLEQHQLAKPEMAEGEVLATIEQQIVENEHDKTGKQQLIGQIQQILQQDANNKQKYADTLKKLDELQRQVRQWERLNNVFGDSNGKVFRRIAQSFILQRLLDQTNYFLSMLSDRYELTGAGRELMILVKDKYLGDAPRPVEMVSGGESFIISIALALGLSNLAMQGFSSDFLFIDEGISQLDSGLCDTVTSTLQQLHHIVHCNIGIISHLDVLADKIPTKIEVRPVSHGTSEVAIVN